MRVFATLLLLSIAPHLLGAQLSSKEKGKKSKEQVLKGSIVSFKDGTLTFRVASDTGSGDRPLSATQYEMVIIVDDNPIDGSVDYDGHTIPMSYPSQTKQTDYQHVFYESNDKKGKTAPEERDLTSCHSRGEDWLVLKNLGTFTGTIMGISVAGQTGYVYFLASHAKAQQRYRFDELSVIGIGACPNTRIFPRTRDAP
jgi:hypothetical protein